MGGVCPVSRNYDRNSSEVYFTGDILVRIPDSWGQWCIVSDFRVLKDKSAKHHGKNYKNH